MLSLLSGQHENRVFFDDFTASSGQFWHILGQNGSGKSSLLLILAGLLGDHKVHYFDIPMSDIPIAHRAQMRCFLYQQQRSEFDIPLRQLLEFYTQRTSIPECMDEYLCVNDLLDKTLSTLSGGQQQRFHIARCLLQVGDTIDKGKAIILLDEPISQLDIKFQSSVLSLLNKLCEAGNIVVMSCHDINQSIVHASHVVLMKNQRFFKQGESAKILSLENLEVVFEHKFSSLAIKAGQKQFLVSN